MQRAVCACRFMMLVGSIAIFACTDSTAPENEVETTAHATVRTPVPSTALQTIGASLVDATDWVLVVVTDETARLKMKSTIKSLADDLVAGRNSKAKQDVRDLRSSLTSLQDLGPALGPIGVALDQIDSEFARLDE